MYSSILSCTFKYQHKYNAPRTGARRNNQTPLSITSGTLVLTQLEFHRLLCLPRHFGTSNPRISVTDDVTKDWHWFSINPTLMWTVWMILTNCHQVSRSVTELLAPQNWCNRFNWLACVWEDSWSSVCVDGSAGSYSLTFPVNQLVVNFGWTALDDNWTGSHIKVNHQSSPTS